MYFLEGFLRDSRFARWRLGAVLLLIAVLTMTVFWPVLQNGFIDFDDEDYVVLNSAVRQGLTLKSLAWAFTAFHAGNWHPLTWISHMLDVQLYGLNPLGHHATSLVLHAVNALLLCLLLHRMTGYLGRSLLVALLFALHPLHVESVAWVAERKDVLSTLFWLLTLWTYVGYTRHPSWRRYSCLVLVFILGLMAKQMLVTLPLVLILLDYWPLQRLHGHREEDAAGRIDIRRQMLEKIPLLLLSAGAAAITIRAQGAAGAIARGDAPSLLVSSGNAFISYLTYIRNMFFPVDLALFYPFEPFTVTPLKVTAAIVSLAIITTVVAMQRKSRPFLLFGWLWYLVTLLPVIGFIRIGEQALADRYTYIPLTGLFLMIVWGGAEVAAKRRRGMAMAAGLATAGILFLSALTVRQVHYWQNSYDLFAHALAVVDRNWLAHNNMGIMYAQHNQTEEAIFHFQESVRLNPKGWLALRNLGNCLQMTGRYAEAVVAFRQAVQIHPDAESRYRLGLACLVAGDSTCAYREYEQLLLLDNQTATRLLDSMRIFNGR